MMQQVRTVCVEGSQSVATQTMESRALNSKALLQGNMTGYSHSESVSEQVAWEQSEVFCFDGTSAIGGSGCDV